MRIAQCKLVGKKQFPLSFAIYSLSKLLNGSYYGSQILSDSERNKQCCFMNALNEHSVALLWME